MQSFEKQPQNKRAAPRTPRKVGYGWILLGRVALILVAGTLLFILASVYGGYRWVRYEKTSGADAIQRAQELGLPLTSMEYRALYPPLPAEAHNAATIYRKSFREFPTESDFAGETEAEQNAFWEQISVSALEAIPLGEPVPESVMHNIRSFIDAYQANFAWLDLATMWPECQFVTDFTNGFDTPVQFQGYLIAATNRYFFRVVIYIQDGDWDRAIRDVGHMRNIGLHLRGEPILFAADEYVANRARTLRCAQYLLNRGEFTDERLNELATMCEDNVDPNIIVSWLSQGTYHYVGLLGPDYRDWPPSDVVDAIFARPSRFLKIDERLGGMNRPPARFLFAVSRLKVIKYVVRLAEGKNLMPWEMVDLADSTVAYMDEIDDIQFIIKKPISSYSRVLYAYAYTAAIQEIFNAAIAVERYRLAYGKLPENIEALVPEFLTEIPLDSMTGAPLHYVLDPSAGYRLYSVGPNRIDDGGVRCNDGSYRTCDGDIVIRVAR